MKARILEQMRMYIAAGPIYERGGLGGFAPGAAGRPLPPHNEQRRQGGTIFVPVSRPGMNSR